MVCPQDDTFSLENPLKSLDYLEYYKRKTLELIKYHIEFAKRLGFNDIVCEEYTESKVAAKMTMPNNKCFVITSSGEKIGVLRIELNSQTRTIIIHSVMIDEQYRNSGYFEKVIDTLKHYFTGYEFIELECWYDIPAHNVYEHLGFKEVYRGYRLDLNKVLGV